MMSTSYPGNELEIFRHAENWKTYFGSVIKPHLKGDVLEVGAGNGSNTEYLLSPNVSSWTCLEPDQNLVNQMSDHFSTNINVSHCQIIQGSIYDLEPGLQFDSIIYIDVLEHIENDVEETLHASRYLKSDGVLVILCPAHQSLYSEFDKSIGHFRRYNRKTLKLVVPDTLKLVTIKYLDSIGIILSLINRWVLNQDIPTLKQIKFWDTAIIPASRVFDAILLYSLGKTVVGVWKK